MVVCPLCEHPQAVGTECEVCGRPLGPGAVDVPVPALDGLEPTGFAPQAADAAPIPDLEPTRFLATLATPEAVADLERTAAPPVHLLAEPIPDLERTQAETVDDLGTPVGPVVCRYCRTPAGPGERLCGRCGMKLPVPVAPRAEAGAAASLCSCGAPVRGRLCPACGARLAPSSP